MAECFEDINMLLLLKSLANYCLVVENTYNWARATTGETVAASSSRIDNLQG